MILKKIILVSPYEHEFELLKEKLPELDYAYYDFVFQLFQDINCLAEPGVLLIVSTRIEDMNYLDAVQKIKQMQTSVKGIVYATSGNSSQAKEVMSIDDFEYVDLNEDFSKLVDAIKAKQDSVLEAGKQDKSRVNSELKDDLLAFALGTLSLDDVSDVKLTALKEKFESWKDDQMKQLSSKSILVIEDEHVYNNLLLEIVSPLYDAKGAVTITEGLQCLSEKQYHILLLDMFLPDGESIDFIPKIKELYPELLIIVITAFDFVDRTSDVLKEGVYELMNKPILKEQLLEIVKAADKQYNQNVFMGDMFYDFLIESASDEEKVELLLDYCKAHSNQLNTAIISLLYPKLEKVLVDETISFNQGVGFDAIKQLIHNYRQMLK